MGYFLLRREFRNVVRGEYRQTYRNYKYISGVVGHRRGTGYLKNKLTLASNRSKKDSPVYVLNSKKEFKNYLFITKLGLRYWFKMKYTL